jgi:hypothetical protein
MLPLEEVLPEWCALIRIFLQHHLQNLRRWAPAAICDDAQVRFGEKSRSPTFSLFALSLAQHYGLPTAGLDVTDSLDVALFFALMKYQRPREGYLADYVPVEKSGDFPVIYVLCPSERFQLDYNTFRPPHFPVGRPDKQRARFMHTGWGFSTNACARQIFLAFYLDPDGDFGRIPTPQEMFPPGESDRFAEFLAHCHAAHLPDRLREAMKSFYVVRVP